MSDAATDAAEAEGGGKKGGGLKSLLLGLVLALVGAGGGYFAATSGLLGGGGNGEDKEHGEAVKATSYVDVPPMVVSVARPGAGIAQLRLRLSLEVSDGKVDAVTETMPRVLDVLNSYLRALDMIDIGDAATLERLRAQMLRRVQIVLGEGIAHDLLILEFVVN